MFEPDVDEGLKSERAVVEEEYRQRILASPYGRFFHAIAPSSLLKHPVQAPEHRQHRRPRSGEPGRRDRVPQPLLSGRQRERWWLPAIRPEQLDLWVDKYFGPVPRPAKPLHATAVGRTAMGRATAASPSPAAGAVPAVAISWLAPTVTSPDAAGCASAAALLSAGESSRLNQSAGVPQQAASQAGFEPICAPGRAC